MYVLPVPGPAADLDTAIRARVSRSCTTMVRYRVEMIPRRRQRAKVRSTVSRQEPIQEASSAWLSLSGIWYRAPPTTLS